MREPKFLHRPPATSADTSLKFRQPLLGDMPAPTRNLSLQPSRWQGHPAQLALDALDRMIAPARQERRVF